MVNLKQQLELVDYFAPLVAALIFAFFMILISVTCLNYCCVGMKDDITKFEEWGYRHHIHAKLGPHTHSFVERNTRTKHQHAQLI